MGIDARPVSADGMTIIVSPVTPEELPAIAVIERAAFTDPWSEKSFRDALSHPAIYFAAARSGADEVLGYVVAWFVADEGQIANLAVTPKGWGKGIYTRSSSSCSPAWAASGSTTLRWKSSRPARAAPFR